MTNIRYHNQDFYASPGDPLFYFHHGMLDRLWWIWQMQDPENRVDAVPGQAAIEMPGMERPEGEEDIHKVVVDLGWTAPGVKLMDLNEQMGGLGGEMCYIYV